MPYTLFYGNDLKLVKKELDLFEKRAVSENPGLEVFSTGEGTTLSGILDKITSENLFSAKQLIKIYEIEKVNWIEKILDYDTDNQIVMVSYKTTCPIKNKKKVNCIELNLPKNYELEKIIANRFKSKIAPEALEYLSKNMASLLDLDEMEDLMAEEKIELLTLDAIYRNKGDTEAKIFLIIEDIINHKIQSAIPEVSDFLESGGYSGQMISLLASQLEKLYQIKKLSEGRVSDKEIAENLQISPYILGKLKRTAGNFSVKKLEALLLLIPKIDYQIRYYDKAFTQYFLEKLILEAGEKN